MKILFRSHIDYLCNRTNLLILSFVLLLSFFGFSEASLALDKNELPILNNRYFFENSFFILKLLSVFAATFTFSYAFTQKSDQYGELLLVRGISRSFYFYSKVLVIALYLAYFLVLEFALYLFCGAIFLKQFYPPGLLSLFRLLLLNLYYGLISLAFMQFLRNLYIVIIPFFMFIVGIILNENEGKLQFYYNMFFPNFLSEKPELFHGDLHILTMLTVIILINQLLYLSRDL